MIEGRLSHEGPVDNRGDRTLFGPILDRELLVSARSPKTYSVRATPAIFGLVLIGGGVGLAWYRSVGELSIGDMAQVGQGTSILFGVILALLSFLVVPSLVAIGVAAETERGTLSALLATPLTSGEIVLGKLGVSSLVYASILLGSLPVAILLTLLGGIDPRLVLLSYAVMASTVFMLAGMAAFASVRARTARGAVRTALRLGLFWVLSPIWDQLFGWLSPRYYPPIRPAFDWIVASSPLEAARLVPGIPGARASGATFAWMFGLQLLYGLSFLGLAVWRLRPAFRSRQDGSGGGTGRRKRWGRHRLFSRPPCGDDPVLWKEIWVARNSIWVQILLALMFLGIGGGLGYLTTWMAIPAFLELREHGYGSGPTQARETFQGYTRVATVIIGLTATLIVVGTAAEGIATERTKDTWSGLLATPLTGREILRAKKIGALWRSLPLGIGLLVIWLVGLVVGSIHPLGFLASLLGTIASAWFLVEMGTYCSLGSRTLQQATNRALGIILLLLAGALGTFLPWPFRTVFWGVGSIPFTAMIPLASFEEVHALLSPSHWSRPIWTPSGEGILRMVATFALSVVLYASLARWLNRRAGDRFDRLNGRPYRDESGTTKPPTSGRGRAAASAAGTGGMGGEPNRVGWRSGP